MRILAVLAGAVLLGLSALSTFGTALLVPLGMLVAWYLQRRRGRRLSTFGSWSAGVLTFGVTVTLGVVVATTVGPLQSLWPQFQKTMEEAQRRPPPPPPAIFRNLPAQPQQPLPPAATKVLTVVSLIIGIEMMALFLGSLAWAAVTLLSYGITGPRRYPVPEVVPLSS